MRIGFYQPTYRQRSPVYTAASVKVGYLETRDSGTWFTDLTGRLVARIVRYHIDLPAPSASCSAPHVVVCDPNITE